MSARGKTILVTGANSGIGKAAATQLARQGARVVMACRNGERGEKARREVVRRSGNDDVDLIVADLSSRDGIRSLADTFRSSHDRLDVLLNNAGILSGRRRVTGEGYEMTFFVNHIAYFMLTNLLIDMLCASAPARIVSVSSTAHSRGTIDFDDLQSERDYQPWQAYSNSKLANVVFTYELARRLEGTGVTANCVHPGVIHTNLLSNYNAVANFFFHAFRFLFKGPDEGAATPVYLAGSPEVEGVTGKYFRNLQPMGTIEASYERDVQRRLWEVSEEITGCQGMIPLQ